MALIPDTITAGVTLDIPITLTAYQPPDWSVTLYLRGPDSIDIPGVADGHGFRLHAPAATSKPWAPGYYAWSLRATDDTDVVEVQRGGLEIHADLADASAGFDAATHVRKVLTAIEAVIEGRASKDQQMYRINNRELQRTPISDLLRLRNQYRRELAREEAAANGRGVFGRTVRVRV